MRRRGGIWRFFCAVLCLAGGLVLGGMSSHAQMLEQALAEAYINNPTLNAQRAALRAIDETVPRALSGYRPTITAGASAGIRATDSRLAGGGSTSSTLRQTSIDLVLDQNLFRGFRTTNEVRSAESTVNRARETLRDTEQTVLLTVATVFMDVLRDDALVELQRQNLEALQEQLRATRDRFTVGEVTRTDVALSEASVAGALSALIQAQAQLATSKAVYRQRTGRDPGKLQPGRPIERLLPSSFAAAIQLGLAQHPTILAGQYAVDIAALQVKIAEGALLPTLSGQAAISRTTEPSAGVDRQNVAAGSLNLSVPIYQGGAEYAAVRQAKETLGETRIRLDATRDEVRAAVVQFWTQLDAAKAGIEAAQTQVTAQQIALDGITEEYRVGQRTILDVLTARAQLVTAQSNLVVAQRNRVVNSYSVLGSLGRLDAETLSLRVAVYAPDEHYYQIRDSWFGLRTPDGR